MNECLRFVIPSDTSRFQNTRYLKLRDRVALRSHALHARKISIYLSTGGYPTRRTITPEGCAQKVLEGFFLPLSVSRILRSRG